MSKDKSVLDDDIDYKSFPPSETKTIKYVPFSKYDRLEKAADKLRNDFQSLYMDSCDGYFRRTGEQIIAEFDEAIKQDEGT